MGNAVFLVGGHLGDGFLTVGDVKNGIIAKAIDAYRFAEDFSFDGSRHFEQDLVGISQAETAAETGGAFLLGDVFQKTKDFFIVGPVPDSAVGVIDARKACGINPGIEIQGVDLQSRVVREDGLLE